MKNFLIVLAGLVVVLGGLLFLKGAQIASLIGFATEAEEAGLPPVPVATVPADGQEWEETLRFTGSLRPVQGVTLAAEEGGTVVGVAVENGARVAAGDLLVELDTRRERADLASAEARLRLAAINLDRTKGLLEKRIIAQSEYDSALAASDEARAEVERLQAIIAKRTVRAPFAGQVGIRQVNIGQTVNVGDPLLPLHSSDPIYVEFAVPQTKLPDVKLGRVLRVTGDGIEEPALGEVTAINPQIDEASRTARVQGTLSNAGGAMRPGQFVNVEVVLPGSSSVVAVPASAVVRAAFGDSVFLVEEKEGRMVARQQFVQVGRLRGDFVSITKGLAPGDRVVSAGAFKLSNGMTVAPNDNMQPEPSLTPEPDNA